MARAQDEILSPWILQSARSALCAGGSVLNVTAPALGLSAFLWLATAHALAATPVDQQRATSYFKEAATLCERDGGHLWGVYLCGPMVFADGGSRSIATNRPSPAADWPPALGFVNAPLDWGGVSWATYVWALIPKDDVQARGRLLIHELFHRVQPQLGLVSGSKSKDHLDTLEGRYWMRLEWRALTRALGSAGLEQTEAVRDALVFPLRRREVFADAAEAERLDELREGLAQYTDTVLSASSRPEAIADAVRQLTEAEDAPTFVRTFAYPSGSAYGILLDTWSPGWTRRVQGGDDLGRLLMEAGRILPLAGSAEVASSRYGGAGLRKLEEARGAAHKARVAELRRRFVDGPLFIVPRARGAVINTTGATPIPGQGTVLFEYRVTAEWGSLESTGILEAADGATLRLSGPFRAEGGSFVGEGWKVVLAPGWVVVPGDRAGDFRVAKRDGSAMVPSHRERPAVLAAARADQQGHGVPRAAGWLSRGA